MWQCDTNPGRPVCVGPATDGKWPSVVRNSPHLWTWLVTTNPVARVAAALIAGGVLVPLGVPGADIGNFIGYVLWSLWLIWWAITSLSRSRLVALRSWPQR